MFKIEHSNFKDTLVSRAQKTIDPNIHFKVLHAL